MNQYVNASDIIIPDNRQRREFDDKALEQLAESIRTKGLLHPPILRSDGRTLLAGERRIRAVQRLAAKGMGINYGGVEYPQGCIPFSTVGQLDALTLREAELEENTIRKDLTWQETNSAIAELHKLRTEQKALNGERQTLRDTASEILGSLAAGVQIERIRIANTIADNLSDPEVASAPDEKAALKIINRKATDAHRARLLEEFGERPTVHSIRRGNAFDLMKEIEDASIDVILSDPPYGIDADSFGSQASATHEYTDSAAYAVECYSMIYTEANRICKPNAFIMLFCDVRLFNVFAELGAELLDDEWKIWETPFIWNKGNGMLPVPDKGPRRSYEAILYAYRGIRKWNAVGASDVIDIPGLSRPEFGAQKPTELYSLLLSRISQPGDTVLDPFAGGGPVIGAADKNKCRAIAFELNERKFNYILTTEEKP